MNKALVLFGLLILLCSCATKTITPAEVIDDKFIDTNPPSVTIKFPFNVYLHKKENGFGANETYSHYSLKSNEKGKSVFITKKQFPGFNNYYYTGADSTSIKNKLYLDNKSSGFCAVGITEYGDNSFFTGKVYKYRGQKEIIIIQLYENTGSKELAAEYWKNSSQAVQFIEDTKYVCNQMFSK